MKLTDTHKGKFCNGWDYKSIVEKLGKELKKYILRVEDDGNKAIIFLENDNIRLKPLKLILKDEVYEYYKRRIK